jgi:uncharacterized membrane protein YjgN (DUF898 family)
MLSRLGKVLYWTGCIFAGLIAAFACLLYFSESYQRHDGPTVTVAILVFAFVVWLIGAALRYILVDPEALP